MDSTDTIYFRIIASNGEINIPLGNFKVNDTMNKFVENNPDMSFKTFDTLKTVRHIYDIIRGYDIPNIEKLLERSHLACLLGLTNSVIIKIGGSTYIYDKDFLTTNFEYFETFFNIYSKLHPDYRAVNIDRSSRFFEYIIDHINENYFNQRLVLNQYTNIEIDASYYGYRNDKRKMTYHPTIDLKRTSDNVIIYDDLRLKYIQTKYTSDWIEGVPANYISKNIIVSCVIDMYSTSENKHHVDSKNIISDSNEYDRICTINRSGNVVLILNRSDKSSKVDFFRLHYKKITSLRLLEKKYCFDEKGGNEDIDTPVSMTKLLKKCVERKSYARNQINELNSGCINVTHLDYLTDIYGFGSNTEIDECIGYYKNDIIFRKHKFHVHENGMYYVFFSGDFCTDGRHVISSFAPDPKIRFELYFKDNANITELKIIPITPDEIKTYVTKSIDFD